MSKVLWVVEHLHSHLAGASAHALVAASELGGTVDALVIGHDCEGAAREAAALDGVRCVRLVDAPHYAAQTAENLAIVVAQLAGAYTHVVLAASSYGKNLGPRVAALLDVAPITEVVAIEAADTFVRPIYAGNALETVRSHDPVKLLTVRSAAFPAAQAGAQLAPIEPAPAGPDLGVVRLLRRELAAGDRPALGTARVVVAGGRGFDQAEQFQGLLTPLAAALGAALGASRAAVDAGFVGNECQVGQTGQIVAPDLYIAIGISGAIQHVAGMRDSRVVVAINKDPEAPICAQADFVLIGDLAEIVPRLTALLQT